MVWELEHSQRDICDELWLNWTKKKTQRQGKGKKFFIEAMVRHWGAAGSRFIGCRRLSNAGEAETQVTGGKRLGGVAGALELVDGTENSEDTVN